jgi:hypothetical protein
MSKPEFQKPQDLHRFHDYWAVMVTTRLGFCVTLQTGSAAGTGLSEADERDDQLASEYNGHPVL